MLEFVTQNASTLFRYTPKAANGCSIESRVSYLHDQVRLTRNEICRERKEQEAMKAQHGEN